jgi:multiple sugar transport system substrate-binding protein
LFHARSLPRRRLVLPLLAAAACLLASLAGGCALPGARAEAEGPVTIRYAFWGAIHEIQVWDDLVRAFEARQDRVRVKLEHIAGLAYHPKLLAMTVGRCAPDVMMTDDEPFPELAENGLFEDLGPWLDRDPEIRRGDYYPQFFDAWVHKGKPYAIPHQGHVLLLYYNRALLRSAGLPEPPDDWDWDLFLEYARRTTRDLDGNGRSDQFGIMRPVSFYHSLPWIWAAGADTLDDSMTRCVLNTPEGVLGLRFCQDLTFKHRVTPLVTELPGMAPENAFLNGRVAMVVHGPWWLRNCRREPGLEWDVAHMPRGPAGRFTRATCEGLSMSVQSRHKEAAWEWIRFVVGEEGQRIIAAFDRGLPAYRAIAEEMFPKPETREREERFLEAMEYARVQKIPVEFGENNVVITREWDLMLLGNQTPEETARNIERGIDKIMAGPQ